MRKRTAKFSTKVSVASLLIGLSLASGVGAQTTPHAGHGDAGSGPAEAPSTRAFKAADAAMMTAMAVPYTGDADVDFRTHMIPHHQGAIDMAKVALAYATDPGTKEMALKIIADQEKEIAEMRAWLAARQK